MYVTSEQPDILNFDNSFIHDTVIVELVKQGRTFVSLIPF